MNCCLTVLKLALVFFLLGVWAVGAPPVHAQQQTLTGWFTFIVADYPSDTGFTSETTYFLTEDSGARHELLIDGQEFAHTTVRVTTLGEQVLRGVSGTYPLADFPRSGDTTRIRWEESLQNFVIIP